MFPCPPLYILIYPYPISHIPIFPLSTPIYLYITLKTLIYQKLGNWQHGPFLNIGAQLGGESPSHTTIHRQLFNKQAK